MTLTLLRSSDSEIPQYSDKGEKSKNVDPIANTPFEKLRKLFSKQKCSLWHGACAIYRQMNRSDKPEQNNKENKK